MIVALSMALAARAEVWSCWTDCGEGETDWGWGESEEEAEAGASCEEHGSTGGKPTCEVTDYTCAEDLPECDPAEGMAPGPGGWFCAAICNNFDLVIAFGSSVNSAYQNLSCDGLGGIRSNIVCEPY